MKFYSVGLDNTKWVLYVKFLLGTAFWCSSLVRKKAHFNGQQLIMERPQFDPIQWNKQIDLGWGLNKPGHRLHVCESWHSIKEHGTWKKHPRTDPKTRRPDSNRIVATGTAGSVHTHTHSFDTLLMGPPQEQFPQYSTNILPAFCLSVKGEQRVLTGSTTGCQATEPGMGSIFSFIFPVRVHLCTLHKHL